MLFFSLYLVAENIHLTEEATSKYSYAIYKLKARTLLITNMYGFKQIWISFHQLKGFKTEESYLAKLVKETQICLNTWSSLQKLSFDMLW